ncbi:MAG: hypothetical protein Q4G30_10055 [Actinomycetaceae bacterium]|nr:hypothetical protein [Actinomycetaceae bacterium]
MKATPEEQRQVLVLQGIDTTLAQLKHERATLETIAQLAELEARETELNKERTQNMAELSDAKRELTRAEDDVMQVRTRASRQRTRLDEGTASPKELQAIQEELELLGVRQGELEDQELAAMEAMEALEQTKVRIESDLEHVAQDRSKTQEAHDAADNRLGAQISQENTTRDSVAASIPPALLREYENIRQSTGGLGAVALRGVRVEGMALEFPTVEINKIRKAAPDDVLISEEYEYMLIRVEDEG